MRAALVGRDQREAADAELAAGADDAQRDLAAAGDGDALERRAHQPRLPALEERGDALAALLGCAALGDRLGRARRLRRRVAVAQPGDQRLGRAHRLRAAAQHGCEHALDGGVERLVVGVHLVHEADRARAVGCRTARR